MCFLCVRSDVSDDNFGWLSHVNTQTRSVDETQDAAADASTIYSVQVGDVFYGNRDSFSDRDWIAVDLVEGENYVFTMTATTMRDPHLSLFGPDRALVAMNDDINASQSNYDSEITYTASKTGTYYLQASSYYLEDGGSIADVGEYQLAVAAGGAGSGQPVESITWGYQAPQQINVYFAPGGQSFNDGYYSQTTSAFDQTEIDQSMLAFQQYENVANVKFNRVTDPNQADFFMVETTSDSWLGYWGVGGGRVTLAGTSYTLDGWGVFANNGTGWSSLGLTQGGYGFITLIHEIGHGMGLAHPHDTGGGSDVMQGVTSAFNSLGNSNLNQGVFTTMSYNDGWRTADHGASTSVSYGWQGTPMALDIAVLQERYGANTTTNSANTTYVLPTNNMRGAYYQAIWDVGGTDTIVHLDNTAAVIDLRPATLKYELGGGGFVSYATGIHGGFTIAAGVIIENAQGGGHTDTIIGNGANNTINGGAGADIMYGYDGNDVFDVSSSQRSGNDQFYGGLGDDTFYIDDLGDRVIEYADEGIDTVYSSLDATFLGEFVENVVLTSAMDANAYSDTAGDTANRMTGNGFNNVIKSYGGDDYLDGGAGDDALYGGDGNDSLTDGAGNDWSRGEAGNDTFIVGLGDDWYLGGDGVDTLVINNAVSMQLDLRPSYGKLSGLGNDQILDIEEFVFQSGNDFAQGNAAANTFIGNAGNDTLLGDAGSDLLDGGAGVDVLAGGLGNDNISGGLDDDRIVDTWGQDSLDAGDGNDVIHSFHGNDIIDAGAGNDTIYGGRGDDVIHGGAGDDYIYGDTVLFAAAGADELIGGLGNDTLQGGFGADTFVFDLGQSGADVIQRIDSGSVDFQVGLDRLKFTGLTADFQTNNVASYLTDTEVGVKFEYQDMSVLILGISVEDLTADSFVFV